LRLKGANAGGGVRIQDAGRLPAFQQRFEFLHGDVDNIIGAPEWAVKSEEVIERSVGNGEGGR
jgi:hypothetical protein